MQDKPTTPEQQRPADIAREAFRRLAARRIAPTPEAYREIYDEIAGIRSPSPPEKILADLATRLTNGPGDMAAFSRRFNHSLNTRDWENYGKQLELLVEKHLMRKPAERAEARSPTIEVPPSADKSISLVDVIEPLPEKKPSIPLVDDIAPAKTLSIALLDPQPPQLLDDTPLLQDGQLTRMLREMLIRTLTRAVVSLLQEAPALAKETESLASAINTARNKQTLTDVEARLKQFCFKVELKSGDMQEERELLLRLFQLLLENIGELLEDDSWLRGQIANVQDTLSGNIDYVGLMDATRSLKEVIYKQSLLKHSLSEAKARVKDMMLTVIDRLGTAAANTGDYHKKIAGYSEKIVQAKGAGDLNKLLDDILHDTRVAQLETQRSHDDMLAARQEVQAAETRIQELETELAQMSELAREDQLTGSLNRRGLDDILEREIVRSERRKSPLCIALLDLDDFKRLNDTHGHDAGDEALIHLVRVVKDTLRAMDVIGRFGGEEFVIVLPDTPLQEAMHTVTRVQRELTKQIFMHNHERLLITFSAGVALRSQGETVDNLIKRADSALYKAKHAGKNRVISAE